jgi:predicted transcriptional regulator
MFFGREVSAWSEELGCVMPKIAIALSTEMHKRLEELAGQMELSVDECAQQALAEFIENWEDHLRVVAALQEDEARPDLRPVAADHG